MNTSETLNMRISKYSYFLVFIIVGILVRYLPNAGYPPIPTGYGVYVDWGTDYILKNGYIYKVGLFQTTIFGSGINYASLDVLGKVLAVEIALFTGISDLYTRNFFYQVFPWAGTLFIPLFFVLWYKKLSSNNKVPPNFYDMSLIFLVALFPTSNWIAQTSQGGHSGMIARGLTALLLILFVSILTKKKSNIAIVYVILLISLQLMYHTWALYHIIIVFSVIILLKMFKNEQFQIVNILYLNVALFVASTLYFNYDFFENYVTYLTSIFESSSTITTVISNGSYSYVNYLNLINNILIYFFIFLFFIYIAYMVKTKNAELQEYETILIYYCISLIPVAIFVYLWGGFTALYGRMTQIGVIISFLVLSYLVTKLTGKCKLILRCLIIVTITLSIFTYAYSDYDSTYWLVDQEYESNLFVGHHMPKNTFIFSDFRLVSPLLYHNDFLIVGIDSQHNSLNDTSNLINSVYHGNDIKKAEECLYKRIGNDSYWLYTSKRQTLVGITDYINNFEPASTNYTMQFEMSNSFDKIYTSKHVNIYVH